MNAYLLPHVKRIAPPAIRAIGGVENLAALNARLEAGVANLLEGVVATDIECLSGVLTVLEDLAHPLGSGEDVSRNTVKVSVDHTNDVAVEGVGTSPVIELVLGDHETNMDEPIDGADLLHLSVSAVAKELLIGKVIELGV